jgi:hypothetical protein
MKTNMKTMLMLAGLLALGAAAFVVNAQDNGGSQNGDGQNGPPMRGHRPPVPAIVAALDANHDGVIDADEIANAPAALKSLDKNGDGKLTPDEFMGKRPAPPQHSNGGGDAGGPPDGPPPGQ